MNPFLILSYPRSRSAWLANFLSHGNVACGHELMAECRSPHQLPGELARLGRRFVGNADTFQAFHIKELVQVLPDARLVVIKRSIDEVAKSLRALGLPDQVDALTEGIRWAESLSGTLSIPFESLDHEFACQCLQSHVAPGEPFDRRRWAMLRDFNLEITPRRHGQLAGLATFNHQPR